MRYRVSRYSNVRFSVRHKSVGNEVYFELRVSKSTVHDMVYANKFFVADRESFLRRPGCDPHHILFFLSGRCLFSLSRSVPYGFLLTRSRLKTVCAWSKAPTNGHTCMYLFTLTVYHPENTELNQNKKQTPCNSFPPQTRMPSLVMKCCLGIWRWWLLHDFELLFFNTFVFLLFS